MVAHVLLLQKTPAFKMSPGFPVLSKHCSDLCQHRRRRHRWERMNIKRSLIFIQWRFWPVQFFSRFTLSQGIKVSSCFMFLENFHFILFYLFYPEYFHFLQQFFSLKIYFVFGPDRGWRSAPVLWPILCSHFSPVLPICNYLISGGCSFFNLT